jgi:hypothetical protein
MKSDNFIQTLTDNKNLIWPFIQKNLNQIKDFPGYCKLDKKYQSLVDFHLKMETDY